jgi:hypothetical protein
MNLVTPKAGAKRELLLNEPVTEEVSTFVCLRNLWQKLQSKISIFS